MKSLPLNPYIAGNPVSDPNGFFGREDIFREVMQVLRHPHSNAIVLYGQRRIGKTSVLLQLEKQLAASGEFPPVYFDLQDKAAKPLSEVLYELAQRIVAKTGQAKIDRANFDGTGKYFYKNFIPAAVNAAAKGGLVLLFDEFDVLDSTKQSQAGEAFFPWRRPDTIFNLAIMILLHRGLIMRLSMQLRLCSSQRKTCGRHRCFQSAFHQARNIS